MGEYNPSKQPLLSTKDDDFAYYNYRTSFLLLSTKRVLKFAMWGIFICWATFLFLLPLESVNSFYIECLDATSRTVFGLAGGTFLICSGPIFVIAFLGVIYLALSGEEEVLENKKQKPARFHLWTFPVIVDGPFGVVSAAELIGILLFSVFIIWAVSVYAVQNYNSLSLIAITYDKTYKMLELTGLRFGFIGIICLAFLFLPVARGSVLLRLIDIPFEHAIRYHVWLGHLTMMLFTLHGLSYATAWAMQGHLIHELFAWENHGIANLPGVISLLSGLLMWVTSLPPVRRLNFEFFFYTHQLYVIFVVFLALHAGDFIFCTAGAGIFIFLLDRFLRFFQSRKMVDVLSAKCLPSGAVEIVLSKPENLRYNALSWIFLQFRELSILQWHPFSVSSSPLEGKHHLTVLIKVLGNWTEKLRSQILNVSDRKLESDRLHQSHLKLKAYVEGPYGHESPYHLTYENLILVAGGIGISPFLAILSDVLLRIRDSKPCQPRNILIVWAVKRTEELPLLHSLDMESLCPQFSNSLNLEIQTYVTRETEPSLEEGSVPKSVNSSAFHPSSRCGMSALVGTGNIMWSGIYMIASTVGFVISVGLLDVYYVHAYNISYLWYKGLLLIACMAASIFLFGGFVIGLWHLWERKTSVVEEHKDGETTCSSQNNCCSMENDSSQGSFVSTIKYGKRPDFHEIFGNKSEEWGNVNIGVIVCGPPTLQTSTARECRTQNLERRGDGAIFHFNSHSFDL